MAIRVEDLGIHQLSVRERLDLIEQIWDTLPETVNTDEVPAWHLEKLTRRRTAAEATPGQGRPWREALAGYGEAP